jgi:tRNA A37 threonylcarbamoyladenosine dehydratase
VGEPTNAPEAEGADEGETRYRLHRRFDRIGRLVGDRGMARLFGARVTVIGLGGVGSFAVEALARSGIGHLRLVDFDRVCVTNSNRQLQALSGTIARRKAQVLAERLRQVNPQINAEAVSQFYSARTADEILSGPPDFVIDAIDNVTAKCHLLATCRARDIPVVSSMGASGRLDPTRIVTCDLAETKVDPLANTVRRALRKKYAFPQTGPFGIHAVYTPESPAEPHELTYDAGDGFRCVCPGGSNDFHSCEERRVIYGTAAFVTGAFGLACASLVVRALAGGRAPS